LEGKVYYVNKSLGDDGNGGTSINDAWKTMDYAKTQISNGDVILSGILNIGEEFELPKTGRANYAAYKLNETIYENSYAPVMQSSVTKNDITWTFDTNYQVGQFITGDYYVIDPGGGVSITGITPVSEDVEGRIANGSMINPDPDIYNESSGAYDVEAQGYDNAMWIGDHHYYSDLNVAYGVNGGNPLVVTAGDSLISTKSVGTPNNRPQIQSAEILTVLSEAPPSGSFRPAYVCTDKTLYNWDAVQANLNKLANLSSSGISGIPSVETAEAWFERPWLEHISGHFGAYIHPVDNMPEFGGDVSDMVGEAALWLNMDNESKENVLIGFIQYGIDLYHIVDNGEVEGGRIINFKNNGGHAAGRKFPILFAGVMLSNQDMIDKVTDGITDFAEDMQTFYVTQDTVDYESYSEDMCGMEGGEACGRYTESMIGMPDWGITHGSLQDRDTALWNTRYRRPENGAHWGGWILAAIAMNLITDWGHDVIFDYFDRYIQYEDTYESGTHSFYRQWVEDVYTAYRSGLGSTWTLTDWSSYNTIVSEIT
jgi:hypothetical protein